jgi:hypothetical protein
MRHARISPYLAQLFHKQARVGVSVDFVLRASTSNIACA